MGHGCLGDCRTMARMQLVLRSTFGDAAMRHGAEITSLSIPPDDSVVVASDGGQPGRAIAWDLATGAARTTVSSRTYSLTSAAISNDGARIAISGFDNRAIVFDARSGATLRRFETRAASHATAFSPDGDWLLVGDDRVPRLFSLRGGAPRALKGHLSALRAVCFSPDGRWAVTAGGDRKVKLQDVAKAKVVATHPGYASVVAFLDNDRFFFAGFDCSAIVEVPSGKLIRDVGLGFVDAVAISGDGRRLAVKTGRENARVVVTDLDTGAIVFDRTFDPIRDIALTHAGDRLVFARSAMLAQGASLEVWSVADGERLLPRGSGHLGSAAAIGSYGKSGRAIAVSASSDRTLKLWDIDDALEIETIEGGADGLTALAVTADGRTAITSCGSSRKGSLQRWDIASLRVVDNIDVGDLGTARALAMSPDSLTVAASFVRRSALFDVATGKRRVALERHKGQVDAIAFSADGRFVITGAADHLVKIWRVADGREVHALAGHSSFVHALAPLADGTVVSVSSEFLRWDIESGMRRGRGSFASGGEVRALAVSPDGAWLAGLRPFTPVVELWSVGREAITPVHTEKLEASPACVAFVGPRALLVGTKQGQILRFEVEG
jgi:WD40 repeat protein